MAPAEYRRHLTVGPDGTIYLLNVAGRLFAVGSNGQIRWTVDTAETVKVVPALGSGGTVYTTSITGRSTRSLRLAVVARAALSSGPLTSPSTWVLRRWSPPHRRPGECAAGTGIGSAASPTNRPGWTISIGPTTATSMHSISRAVRSGCSKPNVSGRYLDCGRPERRQSQALPVPIRVACTR